MNKSHAPAASVILPIYNQSESLRIVLKHLSNQQCHPAEYEIIVVDDGSTDALREKIASDDWPLPKCKITYIHQENQGRAIARNAGVEKAQGDRLIFCDGDRVPSPTFVAEHLNAAKKQRNMVVIGCPWDFFGKASLLKTEANTNWQRIVKLSRKPQYYEKIMNLYSDGKTESPIAWCTFLVGNSSIDRRAFESTGGFDPGFTDWGFEHFEFAYRLKKQDFMFYSCPQAESFHLPHPRQSGFYQSMIHSSMKYFMQLHPKVPVNALERFLLGEISLQDFEKSFCVNLSYNLLDKPEIYFKLERSES